MIRSEPAALRCLCPARRLLHFDRSAENLFVAQTLSSVAQMQRAVQPLFNANLLCPDILLNLIQLAFIRDRPILPQYPLVLDAEYPIQLSCRGGCPMKVPRLGSNHLKTPVVDRKIALLESVCFFNTCNLLKAHLFDQPVLKGAKEPLDSPFGLGGVGMNDFYR